MALVDCGMSLKPVLLEVPLSRLQEAPLILF